MKRIIYYHPQPIAENPSKGSELRPKKMKEAFQNIGYEVDLVVGYSQQRKKAMQKIKSRIQSGAYYDFLYAESSNTPIPLTDPHHFPVRPLQDFMFFRFLNRENIPIGFFYRDLYWRVDELKKKVSYFKFIPKQIFHWIEWFGVTKTVDHLFLPTKKMKKYFPTAWPDYRLSSLYPGCDVKYVSSDQEKYGEKTKDMLTLLYVGGVRPPYYDISPLLKVVGELKGVRLILCCRQENWKKNAHHYSHFDFSNIEIVHVNSDQIVEYYKRADIFFDIRKPEGYIKDTLPIKIIESVGYQVPLLLLDGTEAADLVQREGAGWIAETVEEAKTLLQDLRINRDKLKMKVEKVRAIKPKHTWEARAQQAGTILEALNN